MGHWSGTNFAPLSFTAHSDFNQIISIYVENVPITINWRWFTMQCQKVGRVVHTFAPMKRNRKGTKFGFVRVTNMHDAKRINNNINGMWVCYEEIGEYNPVQESSKEERYQTLSHKEVNGTRMTIKDNREGEKIGGDDSNEGEMEKGEPEIRRDRCIVEQGEPWTRASYSCKRAAWVEIHGAPIHAWNLVTFQRVAEMWGSFLSLSSNKHNDNDSDCSVMRLLILTDRLKRIEETLELDCGEESFPIRVQKFQARKLMALGLQSP
ncbi:hypothetical protein Gorai_022508 [Gossypium raimondii]|uniref:RRM domain-containing protein n=1 Tax=Gossypium raimondii TaxID=29730 RepID=A0A7J8NTE5_GOSRA|nr:hypothetical protein [Gossypium raimondii]